MMFVVKDRWNVIVKTFNTRADAEDYIETRGMTGMYIEARD